MNDVVEPFQAATAVRSLGDGTFVTNLHPAWAVGERPHGGYLLAVLAQATTELTGLDPLAVSAQFLRPHRVGPVLIRTEVVKTGRTATVVRAALEQRGQVCVDTTTTLGKPSVDEVAWLDVPDMPATPPSDAIDLGGGDARKLFALAEVCDVRLDPEQAAFLNGERGEPRLRLWAKPRGGQPDLLFSLVAGDITVPVTYNLGHYGWTPTVQLTALLRAVPSDGWLRVVAESKFVQGTWFDEDATVVDSAGRIVCQARQLALIPKTS